MSWLSELFNRRRKKKNAPPADPPNYYDATKAGLGYPGVKTFRVYLRKLDFGDTLPGFGGPLPSRHEACRRGIDAIVPLLRECGRDLEYVDTPDGAHCVIPYWSGLLAEHEGYTDSAGNITFALHSYSRLSDLDLAVNAAHEFLSHCIAAGHSGDVRDVAHPESRVLYPSERDRNTARRVLTGRF